MKEKSYKCGYKYCLHEGEKVPQSEAFRVGNKWMHWDCAMMHDKIKQIREAYFDLDPDANFPAVAKVINDLIFKYRLDVDYVKFSVEHYVKTGQKIKSPFALMGLRRNSYMKKKWLDSRKDGDC